MSLWHPRSVLQLVLVSFFAALAPLCLAIFFTVQTLGALTEQGLESTQLVVEVTRMGQEIQRDVLELERRARQFMALSDPDLAQLYRREKTTLLDKLQALQDRMPSQSQDIARLTNSLQRISLPVNSPKFTANTTTINGQQLDQAFLLVGGESLAVKKWLLSSVDRLLEKSAEEADSLIDALVWQLILLASTTLALLLLFAYWINKPVQDLTQEIHQLGTSGLSHTIEISGPAEMRALGTKLEWLRIRLHESEQQKEQFLRHISHELKTPLSSLREGADLLAERITGHLSQQQHEIVEIVRENGIELQRLIENLLDYNQLPNQEAQFEEISLQELLQEILGSYRIAIEKKSLRLQLNSAVENWVADRYRLRTTLDNLLSNAINYTPSGGNIDIHWRTHNKNLIIDVANSGEPIPVEDAERVFEPFFQSTAQRSGPMKGSGIGLSVARECIEAQGGILSLVPHNTLPICFRLLCPAK